MEAAEAKAALLQSAIAIRNYDQQLQSAKLQSAIDISNWDQQLQLQPAITNINYNPPLPSLSNTFASRNQQLLLAITISSYKYTNYKVQKPTPS